MFISFQENQEKCVFRKSGFTHFLIHAAHIVPTGTEFGPLSAGARVYSSKVNGSYLVYIIYFTVFYYLFPDLCTIGLVAILLATYAGHLSKSFLDSLCDDPSHKT